MSDLTTYLGNKIVRWLAGQTMPAAPATIYVALYDGDPKGAGTEVTTTIRAAGRVAVDFEAPPAAGTDNVITTDADSDFGDADAGADVSHVAIFDAAASGNMLAAKALPVPLTIETGELVKVASGDLTFTIGD